MATRTIAIALAATFTLDPAKPAIDWLLDRLDVPHRVELAAYGQVAQELLGSNGVFGKNRDGINVAVLRLADLGAQEGRRGRTPDPEALRRNARDLVDFASAYVRREGSAPLLVVIAPEPKALLADADHASLTAAIEAKIAADLRACGAQVITSAEMLATYPLDAWDDPTSDALAHIPYTPELFAALGAMIARKVRAYISAPHKVLVLDADNTLWNGVVAEDGPDGIVVDEGREALQRFAIAQREAGMLVCIASKNVEDDVLEVFRRKSMPLALEHVAASRVNWQAKSENLRSLAAELGLGLDAFVFVDDSLVACAEVRADCPEVLTVELPARSQDAADRLRHVWAFDRWKVTDEDRRRAELYHANVERERSAREAPSMAAFLASLELSIAIEPAAPADMARVAQLTLRTNQLNFTTLRRTETEIAALVDAGSECFKVTVRDRFGDHGLVGVMMIEASSEALEVDAFLLSCRVLGRGVEHRMIARLGEIAIERGLARVDVPLTKTAKNLPAQAFLREIAGDRIEPRHDGFVAHLSAAHAAAVSHDPSRASEPTTATADDAKPRAAEASLAGRNAVLSEIARDLCTAAAIHARVAPVGKRPRPALARSLLAPRTAIERSIAAICEEALRVAPIGAADDLFLDLGADSFAAVRVAAAMREQLGATVDVVTVQEARTVERLAVAISGPRSSSASSSPPRRSPSIHALRREGSARPLFLARPATRSGGALSYVSLARQIDARRPIHVFQNRPLLDASEPYASVEEMATEYLAAMREIEPKGPYLLGGWCLGGKIAFEMANRLVSGGERVAALVLFDTIAPGGLREHAKLVAKRGLMKAGLRAFSHVPELASKLPWIKVARAPSLMRRFGVLAYFDFDNDDPALIDYAFPGRFDVVRLRAMTPDERWSHVYSTLKSLESGHDGDDVDAARVRRGFKYFAWDHEMDARYSPKWVYPGEMHLFTVRGGAALASGWRKLTSREPRVWEFDMRAPAATPDAHSAMMTEDNAKKMAADLNRVLDGA